jgi:transcriptional regulator NrdR family protein
MKCPVPECKAWVQVMETRKRSGNNTYRRYECGNMHRFVTTEAVTRVIKAKAPKPQ